MHIIEASRKSGIYENHQQPCNQSRGSGQLGCVQDLRTEVSESKHMNASVNEEIKDGKAS